MSSSAEMGGLIKPCDKKAHSKVDLVASGRHDFDGQPTRPLVTGYVQCRKIVLAKIITAVCLWSDHPHWSLGDACCRQIPSQSENWQRFNPLALQPCNLAMSKKTAKNQIYVNSCKANSTLPKC
jgi:hypothetical protein